MQWCYLKDYIYAIRKHLRYVEILLNEFKYISCIILSTSDSSGIVHNVIVQCVFQSLRKGHHI